MSGALAVGTAIARRPAQIPESGTTVPPLALGRAIIAVGTYNTVSTSVSAYLNVAKDGGNLAEVNREAPNTAGY